MLWKVLSLALAAIPLPALGELLATASLHPFLKKIFQFLLDFPGVFFWFQHCLSCWHGYPLFHRRSRAHYPLLSSDLVFFPVLKLPALTRTFYVYLHKSPSLRSVCLSSRCFIIPLYCFRWPERRTTYYLQRGSLFEPSQYLSNVSGWCETGKKMLWMSYLSVEKPKVIVWRCLHPRC